MAPLSSRDEQNEQRKFRQPVPPGKKGIGFSPPGMAAPGKHLNLFPERTGTPPAQFQVPRRERRETAIPGSKPLMQLRNGAYNTPAVIQRMLTEQEQADLKTYALKRGALPAHGAFPKVLRNAFDCETYEEAEKYVDQFIPILSRPDRDMRFEEDRARGEEKEAENDHDMGTAAAAGPASGSGLFSSTLSAEDRAALLGSGDDGKLREELEARRAAEAAPFDDSPGSSGVYNFSCGGGGAAAAGSSAKRHVTAYVARNGMPAGCASMAAVRTSLFAAAAAAVAAGTLGNRGYGSKAAIRHGSITWNLIIEAAGAGNTYTIVHADINGIY